MKALSDSLKKLNIDLIKRNQHRLPKTQLPAQLEEVFQYAPPVIIPAHIIDEPIIEVHVKNGFFRSLWNKLIKRKE